MIADGAGAPLDQGVTTFLFIAAFAFGWVGVARLRNRGFARLPRPLGWASTGLAALAVVLAFVLPPIIGPAPTSARPSTTAGLDVLSPRPGQVFRGTTVTIDVRVRVVGGRVVPFTSTHLIPNEGHIHVFLDGALVSMAYGQSVTIRAGTGSHDLVVQFVAVDHGPFSPPVQVTVPFRVVA